MSPVHQEWQRVVAQEMCIRNFCPYNGAMKMAGQRWSWGDLCPIVGLRAKCEEYRHNHA